MHLSLFSLVPAFFLLFLPSPCSAKNLDSVRSFSYVVSGMMAPQSFYVWTTRDGKVMMQVNYKEKKYRREANGWVLEHLSILAAHHNIIAWTNHRDKPLPDGIYALDEGSYSLNVLWDSGQNLSISGRALPQGSQAFISDLMDLWEKTVQHYPYEPPKEVHSDKIRFFSFHEHLEQNENTWLVLCAQDLSSQVNVRICRGNIAGNKEYYKTAPLFLQKLNGLIKRHKPNLWNDKAKAAQMDNDATAVPYATFYVEYYPEQDDAPDNEYYIDNYGDATPMEVIDVMFNPTECQEYIHFKKELLALFENVMQSNKYRYGE